ncbi:hypothetical protein BDZ85DRAFT_34341 [Elsinoe ampelina]|uniref:Uncharacterized protein n=1 Tax=Elsinoe ampelina TaxID=302913 RepID=A0A6A6G408_9PEZI|nr:hypothetical protein BDZ85DRAFT_34341 [Elsinoe ampelina]
MTTVQSQTPVAKGNDPGKSMEQLGSSPESQPRVLSQQPSNMEEIPPPPELISPTGSTTEPENDQSSSESSHDEVSKIDFEPAGNTNAAVRQMAMITSKATAVLHAGLSKKMDRKNGRLENRLNTRMDGLEAKMEDRFQTNERHWNVQFAHVQIQFLNIDARTHNAGIRYPFERIHDILRSSIDENGDVLKEQIAPSIMPRTLGDWWFALRHQPGNVERLAQILDFLDSDWLNHYGIDGIREDSTAAIAQVARLHGLNWEAVQSSMLAADEQFRTDGYPLHSQISRQPKSYPGLEHINDQIQESKKRRRLSDSNSGSYVSGGRKYTRVQGMYVVPPRRAHRPRVAAAEQPLSDAHLNAPHIND